jgi:hypothetical protein
VDPKDRLSEHAPEFARAIRARQEGIRAGFRVGRDRWARFTRSARKRADPPGACGRRLSRNDAEEFNHETHETHETRGGGQNQRSEMCSPFSERVRGLCSGFKQFSSCIWCVSWFTPKELFLLRASRRTRVVCRSWRSDRNCR